MCNRGWLVVGAVLVAASVAHGERNSEAPRRRGLAQQMMLESNMLRGYAVPECIRVPVPDAPVWTGPFGVLCEEFDPALLAHACFSPDGPPVSWEVQEAVNRAMLSFIQDRYQIFTAWPGADNQPLTLTWSFVPDGTFLPTAPGVGEPGANSTLFASMDAKFGGNRALWIAQFQAAFDRWASITGLSYVRVTNNGNPWDDGAAFPSSGSSNTPGATRGDLRIGSKPIDGGNGILAYNYFPTNGDMVLDSAEAYQGGAPAYVAFRNILTHEHGHGLGLAHVCPIANTKLMEPFLTTAFDGPQHDELRATHVLYGDAYESNDNTASATPLGALFNGVVFQPSVIPGTPIANGSVTSIAIDGDSDYYRVTVAAPLAGSVQVTPLGLNYADYPQDQACSNNVANTNSLVQADLAIDLVTGAGTVVQTVNLAGPGGSEVLASGLFSPAGNMFIRVYEVNAPTQSQLYNLTVTGQTPPTMSATDNAFTDRVRVTWTTPAGGIVSYGVFRGTSNDRNAATQLAINLIGSQYDDLTADAGTTYFYWVEATTGLGGLRPFAGPDTGIRQITAPANDLCANAIDVSAGGVFNGTLVNATNDGTASCGTSGTNPDVWYRYTNGGSCEVTLTVNTCGTNDTGGLNLGIDSVVSFVGACGGTEIACNDDGFGDPCGAADDGLVRDSFLTTSVTAGQSVLIRVSKFSASVVGPFVLNVSAAIANDACANAATILASTPTAFCNVGANTDGPTEAACQFFSSNNVTQDLWYRYTPVGKGRFTVRTCGSTFDTKAAIYPNTCPAATGTVLACADDSPECGGNGRQTSVSAIGVAGTPYLLRIGSYLSASGSGTVTVFCAADVNFSGAASVQDIFDFLEFYFANNPRADINGEGGLSVQDIFDFLETYFSGC